VSDRIQYVQSGRPKFLTTPVQDDLLQMITALLGEVVVLRERLDTLERLLERAGSVTRAEIEAFAPTADADTERQVLRDGALARVFSVLNEELARLRHEASAP
jgi:hypothetical protein